MINKILPVFILFCSALPLPGKIHDYQLYFAQATQPGKETQIIIRKFRQDNQQFYLTVGTKNLETEIVPANILPAIETAWPGIDF